MRRIVRRPDVSYGLASALAVPEELASAALDIVSGTCSHSDIGSHYKGDDSNMS